MDSQSVQQIYETYPLLFPKNVISCKAGWLKNIKEMCDAVQTYIDFEFGEKVPQVEFTEIKERYGVLQISYTGGDRIIKHIIDLCRRLSYKTCEYCGNIGDLYCSTKWRQWSHTKTLCENHAIELFYYRLTQKEF